MTLALVFFIAGLVIFFGAFIFAAVNMLRAVTSRDPFSGFGGMFKRHIGAIIIAALGMAVFSVGLFIGGWELLSRFVK